jgi:hypothetical protein
MNVLQQTTIVSDFQAPKLNLKNRRNSTWFLFGVPPSAVTMQLSTRQKRQ